MFRNAGLDDRMLEDIRSDLSQHHLPLADQFQAKSTSLTLHNLTRPCVVVSRDYFSLES
jgi:hypothetical protein